MAEARPSSAFGTPLVVEVFSAEDLKNVQYFGQQVRTGVTASICGELFEA